MAVIFSFRLFITLLGFHIRPIVFMEPENMGIAI